MVKRHPEVAHDAGSLDDRAGATEVLGSFAPALGVGQNDAALEELLRLAQVLGL